MPHPGHCRSRPTSSTPRPCTSRLATYYLVDATQLPVVREVREQYLNPQQPPASTAVEVRRLARDDLLIEVEAVAVLASFQPFIPGESADLRLTVG